MTDKRHDKCRLAGMIDLLLEQLTEAYSRMPDNLFMDWSLIPTLPM